LKHKIPRVQIKNDSNPVMKSNN